MRGGLDESNEPPFCAINWRDIFCGGKADFLANSVCCGPGEKKCDGARVIATRDEPPPLGLKLTSVSCHGDQASQSTVSRGIHGFVSFVIMTMECKF